MAKDLPYFKFFCSEWNDGDITLENYELQGLFINICSYYWSNECELTLQKLEKKFKNVEKIQELIKSNLIKVYDGLISINFLDEQRDERLEQSKIKSKGGKASAEKRRLAKLQQESNTIPTEKQHVLKSCSTESQLLRKEEIRKEKIIKDNINDDDFDKYRKSYSIYSKKLYNNNAWIESISRMFIKDRSADVNIKTIDKYLRLFLTHLEVIREKHEKENDFTKHFSSWMRIQPSIVKVYPKQEEIRYF
tara:strand:+ start:1758 stop:2504 length:747 start_codon:yes stop_codon:yes gene_type:complete